MRRIFLRMHNVRSVVCNENKVKREKSKLIF